MPTLAQNLTQTLTDVITFPFHLTLFFALAPFRFARWGVKTGRNWIQYFFSLLVFARNDLLHRLEATKKQEQKKSQTTPLPTLASLKLQKEASPEAKKRPASPSPYDDFLDHMRQELKASKDPKARVQTLKKMLEASQDNAMEVTSFASEQQGKMHEMEVQYEDLHKELCTMSFKLDQASQDLASEHRKRIELQSKFQGLQETLDAERKSHKDALQGDRVLLMKMEKDLIEEKKKNAETKQAYQMANLELTELVLREEQKKREILRETREMFSGLKGQIAKEEEISGQLASELEEMKPSASEEKKFESEAPVASDDAKPTEESKEAEPHHEFDPNHFSYKDAILENAQPVHHDYDPKKFSFKDALLEPAFEEPLHESQAPDAQASF